MSKPQEQVQLVQKPSKPAYDNFIAASGIIESKDMNIGIGTPAEGILEKLWVKVGDEVQKGDPLFQIDSRDLRVKLDLEKAELELSFKRLEKTKELYERVQDHLDYRAVSKEEVHNRKADLDIEKSNIAVAEQKISLIEKEIERRIVRAPIDGTVLQIDIRPGMYVSNNKPVLTMGNITSLQVRVDIDEYNIVRFKPENAALAYPKNNTSLEIPLDFERTEKFVIPKKNLTGISQERVDTRVLQVIYTFTPLKDAPLYVGQQVDAFIEVTKEKDGSKI